MIININKHFWIALCLLTGLFSLPAAAQITVADDDVLVYVDSEKTINVLANDNLGACLDARVEVLAQPVEGTATPSPDGKYIVYTPPSGTTTAYNTSFTYQVKCNGEIVGSATVNVNVIVRPENISTADCYVNPQATAWGIREAHVLESVTCYMPALVGDLDGDNKPEIVIGGEMTSIPWACAVSTIKVFKGSDSFASPVSFATTTVFCGLQSGALAIARVPIAGTPIGLIVVAESDFYLRAYDMDGNLIWTSSATWTDQTDVFTSTAVGFADFNNDGIPEVYASNRIFDAANGSLLCMAGTEIINYGYLNYPLCTSIATDVYGDSRLELIQGNKIYEIDSDLRGATLVRSASPTCIEAPSLVIPDGGSASVIDIDNDGKLEVSVSVKLSNNTCVFIYVYDVGTNQVLAQKLIGPVTNIIGTSVSMIGDIDGDKYPEIIFITSNPMSMFAYKYMQGNSLLQEFWRLPHTDSSGLTGMTLFDFNQDGISEIVYRDETQLRIINGSLKRHDTHASLTAPYNMATFANLSGTGYEYPVIADVDNDGEAEIIIAGRSNTSYGDIRNGELRIYKSLNFPWAPARPVWNQYMYNSVNVNNDNTIPQYQFNPATVFPGEDGLLGTADDVRPYNNFLQQQTMLNKDGNPLWLAPDAKIMTTPTYVSYTAPNITISDVVIRNIGDTDLSGPLYISLYKNRTVSAANFLGSVQISAGGLAVNEEKEFDNITLAISESVAANNLLVRVNDNAGVIFHPECDITNNASPIEKNLWYGSTGTDWGTSANWTANLIPYSGEDIEFATTANNGGVAAINDLILDHDRTIGNLINLTNLSTIVPAAKALTVQGKITGSETESDADKIQIQADADNPNGSLILSCANQNTDVYASVQMYARGYKGSTSSWEDNISGSPTYGTVYTSSYSWQYFGVPVEEVKASPTFDGAFVKVYNESRNAANSFYGKWTSLTNNVMMNAFKGYEITQDEPSIYSIKGKLVFCDQNIILTRMAAAVNGASGPNERYGLGQNVIGNSFTAAIPVDKINFAQGVEQTVYLYNTGRFSDWGNETGSQPDGTSNANGITAGNYRAIPKNTASVHPYGNIPSMQGFLLWYKGADDSSVTQTLPYADLTGNDKPQTAPQAALSYLEVTLNSASTVDKLWLFSQEGTGPGFDNGWDGRKFFGTPTAFIFAPTPDGHMQVNTSDNIIGTYISFVGNAEKDYRLSIKKSNLDAKYPTLYLADLKTKEVILLKDEITHYSFTADNAGTAENRFRIKNTADIGGGDLQQLYALLVDNKIQLTNNSNTAAVFSLYDTMGHLVEYRSVEGMSVDMFSKSLMPGVYIVKMSVGGEGINKKIVVSNH